MQGKIIKGIAGFYYVNTADDELYECKAKGGFRNKGQKPLVGDNVIFDIVDEDELKGNIISILKRKNKLIRPEVANVDRALIVIALSNPQPNFNLIDRFLIMMEHNDIVTDICFNKDDEVEDEQRDKILDVYKDFGGRLFVTSTYSEKGIDELKEAIKGNTTVFAGPSGVGKSSILNAITKEKLMDTGSISEKIGRGKHTTRHSEIFRLGDGTYIFDTPGFSSIYLPDIKSEDLRFYYPEFIAYENCCKSNGCVHISEPGCALRAALNEGSISKIRYENYKMIFEELKNRR